jgi:myosin-5
MFICPPVAGLQLGRSKVFLRREAFDRIEAMRSDKFFSSAVVIQSAIRRKQIHMLAAAIKVQCLVRMRIATNQAAYLRVVSMVVKSQSA